MQTQIHIHIHAEISAGNARLFHPTPPHPTWLLVVKMLCRLSRSMVDSSKSGSRNWIHGPFVAVTKPDVSGNCTGLGRKSLGWKNRLARTLASARIQNWRAVPIWAQENKKKKQRERKE